VCGQPGKGEGCSGPGWAFWAFRPLAAANPSGYLPFSYFCEYVLCWRKGGRSASGRVWLLVRWLFRADSQRGGCGRRRIGTGRSRRIGVATTCDEGDCSSCAASVAPRNPGSRGRPESRSRWPGIGQTAASSGQPRSPLTIQLAGWNRRRMSRRCAARPSGSASCAAGAGLRPR